MVSRTQMSTKQQPPKLAMRTRVVKNTHIMDRPRFWYSSNPITLNIIQSDHQMFLSRDQILGGQKDEKTDQGSGIAQTRSPTI